MSEEDKTKLMIRELSRFCAGYAQTNGLNTLQIVSALESYKLSLLMIRRDMGLDVIQDEQT